MMVQVRNQQGVICRHFNNYHCDFNELFSAGVKYQVKLFKLFNHSH
jgi:hypothetical protein